MQKLQKICIVKNGQLETVNRMVEFGATHNSFIAPTKAKHAKKVKRKNAELSHIEKLLQKYGDVS